MIENPPKKVWSSTMGDLLEEPGPKVPFKEGFMDQQKKKLQFLRDEINNGKPLLVPTFQEPTPEDAIKIEISALTIRYEKAHGKGSLARALKELNILGDTCNTRAR